MENDLHIEWPLFRTLIYLHQLIDDVCFYLLTGSIVIKVVQLFILIIGGISFSGLYRFNRHLKSWFLDSR